MERGTVAPPPRVAQRLPARRIWNCLWPVDSGGRRRLAAVERPANRVRAAEAADPDAPTELWTMDDHCRTRPARLRKAGLAGAILSGWCLGSLGGCATPAAPGAEPAP